MTQRTLPELLRRGVISRGRAGVWLWDVRQDRIYGDEPLAQMYALPISAARRSLPPETFIERIHPDHRDRVVRAVEPCLKGGGAFFETFSIISKSGPARWVIAYGTSYCDDHGKPNFFTGTTIDISDLAQDREEALARISDLCVDAHEIAKRHRLDFLRHLLGMALLETGRGLARELQIECAG